METIEHLRSTILLLHMQLCEAGLRIIPVRTWHSRDLHVFGHRIAHWKRQGRYVVDCGPRYILQDALLTHIEMELAELLLLK